MATVNRQVILAAIPVGLPTESDFRLVESPIPTPGDGQFLVRPNPGGHEPRQRPAARCAESGCST